jgi:ubiquinone/menaquinone biosynthesis C-methylase UbiE
MDTARPNHHAHHPGFAGPAGVVAGLGMLVGRDADARLVADLAGVGPGDHVVDVGCGPGVAVREAIRRGARATGVDPAPVMLRLARRQRGNGDAAWLDGSAEAVPVADGEATVVWSIASVHHWADIDAGLAEVRRVLAPGGRFLAVERTVRPGATGHGSHGWNEDQVEAFAAACTAAGFIEVVAERHPGKRHDNLVIRAVRE